MSITKSSVLLLPLVVWITGLSITSFLQSPPTAYSQQDYDEYLITETNNEQKLDQKNIGSGSSINVNCGTNMATGDSPQPITTTCPSVPGETPPNGDESPVFDTITVSETLVIPSGLGTRIPTVAVSCPEGTEVTGGGFDFNPKPENRDELPEFLKSAPTNNGWEVAFEGNRINTFPSEVIVYAECGRILNP
jgi:hypothetical protein